MLQSLNPVYIQQKPSIFKNLSSQYGVLYASKIISDIRVVQEVLQVYGIHTGGETMPIELSTVELSSPYTARAANTERSNQREKLSVRGRV